MVKKHHFIAELIADTRRLLASDELTLEQRAELERHLAEASALSKEDIAVYDFFFEHMPDDEDDLALVILKGHLLIEQRVRSFVEARLFAPTALAAARLTSHQLICLAEAMCLSNEEPKWLFETLRKLNSLRNSLVHELTPAGIADKVDAFVKAYGARNAVRSGLIGCLGNLYAQLAELSNLARRPGFRLPGSRRHT